MIRLTIAASALAFAAAIAAPTIGDSGAATAQGHRQAPESAGLPDALRRAAIATRSDTTGEIAGARIGNTGLYVVYLKTARGCGSGGCRAQVWKGEGGGFVRGQSMPVGRLPIVVLPQTSNGMPLLGVTIYDKQSRALAIMPVGFDGQSYTKQSDDRLLPADSGRPLVTDAMLRPF